MTIKIILVFFSFLFITRISFSQSDSLNELSQKRIVVDSILVYGNDITEEDIILRELTFSPADTITESILAYNKERIYSLGLFTKVNLYIYPLEKKNILIIDVEESWYIYPIPTASIRENDWKKLSYGVYLVVKNFRGRNETIIGSIELGYDPAFRLSYSKPNLVPGSDIFWGADISYKSINNKSSFAAAAFGEDFSQKFITSGVQIGKRFGNYQRASIGLNFNYVETPKYFPKVNASDGRIDRYPSINAAYSYDTRDLIQFPKEGILGSYFIEFKGLGVNGINYQVFGFDFRHYQKLVDDLTFKWRFTSRFSSGNTIPYYDFSRIGYNEKIRGNYKIVQEGNNYYLGSIEFFYPLIKDFNISFDFIPIIPKELLSYRVALYLEIFGDTGAAKVFSEPLTFNSFRSGYGVGLNLLVLPYNLLRFELAFDEYQNTEFILGLGLSF